MFFLKFFPNVYYTCGQNCWGQIRITCQISSHLFQSIVPNSSKFFSPDLV